jgi:hypothetical protein
MSGAKKFDGEKPRVDLVPVQGIVAAARAFTFGARKYSPWNWAKGMGWLRLFGATLRHLFAWAAGEEKDPESGLCHLDHALASLFMLQAHQELQLGKDDRMQKVLAEDEAPIPAAHVPDIPETRFQWFYVDSALSEEHARSPKYATRAIAEQAKEGLYERAKLPPNNRGTHYMYRELESSYVLREVAK